MKKLKDVTVGRQCHIRPSALKGVKKSLGYSPNTTILVSLHSDDDGRSFSLSSDTIVELKENREWKRIKKSI